jgi:hypothetical protein
MNIIHTIYCTVHYQLAITINVAVVYMGRDIWIGMGEIHKEGHLNG